MSISTDISFANWTHYGYLLSENDCYLFDADSERSDVEESITSPDSFYSTCLEACSILERESSLHSQAALEARMRLLGFIPCSRLQRKIFYKLPLNHLISFGKKIAPLLVDQSKRIDVLEVLHSYEALSLHFLHCNQYAKNIVQSKRVDELKMHALDFLYHSCSINQKLPQLTVVMSKFRDNPARLVTYCIELNRTLQEGLPIERFLQSYWEDVTV